MIDLLQERKSLDEKLKNEIERFAPGWVRKVAEAARDLDIHPNVIH